MPAAVEDDSKNSHGSRLKNPAHRVTGPKRRSTVGGWTPEQDNLLMEAHVKFKGKQWKNIAKMVPGRTDVQCLHRYQKVLSPEVCKGPWTPEDDNHLRELVAKLGYKNWSEIAKGLNGRNGKQCRERWNNHLKPSIVTSPWRKEEDSIIMRAHCENGYGWADISKLLPGRSENSIKNRFHSNLKKKLNQWGNQHNSDEKPFSEGYPVTPLCEYISNNDVRNASSLSLGTHASVPLKDRNKSSSSYLIWRRRRENCSVIRPPQQRCGSDCLLSSLTSESSLSCQERRELNASPCTFPDRGHSMDICSRLVDKCTTLRTSPETSLASPAVEIQLRTTCNSPEAILRSRATNFKCIPSIIRKRRIEATPDEATPCNKIHKVDYNQQCVSEDEPLSLELSLSLPSQSRKLEARTGGNMLVEKRLESEFDAVWDSSDRVLHFQEDDS